MKKLLVALVAVGAALALRPALSRKARRMRVHCEQMASKCKQMMSQSEVGEEAGMPEHCKQMAAHHKEKAAQFQADPEAPGSEPEPTVVASGDRKEALSAPRNAPGHFLVGPLQVASRPAPRRT